MFFFIQDAQAHDHKRADLTNWYKGLQSKQGYPCCDGSDATRLEDVDWDTKCEEGICHYRARINGQWIVIPDETIVTGPNLSQMTQIWPYKDANGLTRIRCFMPGSGT